MRRGRGGPLHRSHPAGLRDIQDDPGLAGATIRPEISSSDFRFYHLSLSRQRLRAGAEIVIRLLEATMIGRPISAQTNRLIERQLLQQASSNPTDTLNLLAALVMGSPEFQMR